MLSLLFIIITIITILFNSFIILRDCFPFFYKQKFCEASSFLAWPMHPCSPDVIHSSPAAASCNFVPLWCFREPEPILLQKLGGPKLTGKSWRRREGEQSPPSERAESWRDKPRLDLNTIIQAISWLLNSQRQKGKVREGVPFKNNKSRGRNYRQPFRVTLLWNFLAWIRKEKKKNKAPKLTQIVLLKLVEIMDR